MLTSHDHKRGKAQHKVSEFPLLGLMLPVPRQTKSCQESLEP